MIRIFLWHIINIDFATQVMPNCTNFITECWWEGENQDCDTIFELRRTDDGFCCSFNAVKRSETIDL